MCKGFSKLIFILNRKIAAEFIYGNFSVCWDKEILIYVKGNNPLKTKFNWLIFRISRLSPQPLCCKNIQVLGKYLQQPLCDMC